MKRLSILIQIGLLFEVSEGFCVNFFLSKLKQSLQEIIIANKYVQCRKTCPKNVFLKRLFFAYSLKMQNNRPNITIIECYENDVNKYPNLSHYQIQLIYLGFKILKNLKSTILH